MPRPVPEPPHVCALLVCDHVWRDPRSGAWSIQGVFDRLYARAMPVDLGSFGVYVNVTNMRGRYLLELRLLRARDDREIRPPYAHEPLVVTSPLQRIQFGVELDDATISGAGPYVVRLVSNGSDVQDVLFSVLGSDSGEPS